MANQEQGGLKAFWAGAQPVLHKTGEVFVGIGKVFRIIGLTIFHMRKIFMAIPVVMAAMRMATLVKDTLTGPFRFFIMDVLASWEQSELVIRQVEVSKQIAVTGPLVITAAALVLMFLSRRTIWPWLVSIFTLAIPGFIWLSCTYLPI